MKQLRLIAVLLLFAMLFTVMGVACKKETKKDDEKTNAAATTAASVGDDGKRYDANGYELDDLPDTLDLDGEDITILHWQEGMCPEFEAENNGETISDAVYNRNLAVSERLNVNLKFVPTAGNNKNMESYINMVMADVMAAAPEYDIFGSYSMCGATMAMDGYLADLTETTYLNFEKPWWPANLIGQATIEDRLYFCSGDISTNTLYYMFIIFFNRTLIENEGLDSPYELVENGEWTYEKMLEMTKGFYRDINEDSTRDVGDQYGLTCVSAWADSFFFASGLRTIEQDNDGGLVVSDTWGSSKTHELLTDLCNYFNAGDGFLHNTDSKGVREGFTNFRAIFTVDSAGSAKDVYADKNVNYGVAPVPKFDTEQTEYYTTLGFTYTMYSISTATTLNEDASAVLEALASAAYRITTPQIFEVAFKYKYADSPENIPMWDTIKSSISFDLGRVFATPMEKTTYSLFRNTLMNNQAGSWYSNYSNQESTINTSLAKIMNSFRD